MTSNNYKMILYFVSAKYFISTMLMMMLGTWSSYWMCIVTTKFGTIIALWTYALMWLTKAIIICFIQVKIPHLSLEIYRIPRENDLTLFYLNSYDLSKTSMKLDNNVSSILLCLSWDLKVFRAWPLNPFMTKNMSALIYKDHLFLLLFSWPPN